MQQVFSEVGEVMKYVKTLRGEVRKLHATIRALNHVQAPPPATAAGATGTGAGPASPNKAPRGAFFAADANKDITAQNSSSSNGNTTAAVGPSVKAGAKTISAEDMKTNTTSASAAVTSGTAESGAHVSNVNTTTSTRAGANNTHTTSSANAAAVEAKSGK